MSDDKPKVYVPLTRPERDELAVFLVEDARMHADIVKDMGDALGAYDHMEYINRRIRSESIAHTLTKTKWDITSAQAAYIRRVLLNLIDIGQLPRDQAIRADDIRQMLRLRLEDAFDAAKDAGLLSPAS